jgi:sugar diacid utilization regulator
MALGELEAENELLVQVATAQDELLRIVVHGRGLLALLDRLSELVGNPVAVSDPLYQVLATSPRTEHGDRFHWESVQRGVASRQALDDSAVAPYFRRVEDSHETVLFPRFPELGMELRRLRAPIVGGDRLLGYVTILEERRQLDDLHATVLERATLVLALELMRQRAEIETEYRLIAEFLRDLFADLGDDMATVGRRAALLGIDVLRPWRLLLVDVDDVDELCRQFLSADPVRATEHLADIVRRVVRTRQERAIAVTHGERIVVLYPEDGAGGESTARSLAQVIRHDVRWASRGATVSVAVGGVCQQVSEYRQRFLQAGRALDIARSLKRRDETVMAEELGIYSVLLRREDIGDVVDYAEHLLAPLLRHDAHRGSRLIETLHAYLEENGAFRATARRLHVHLNTLRGRLLRIARLCDCDLADARTRLNFRIALDVYQMTRTGRTGRS